MTDTAQVSISGGSYPRWGRDGKRLYFYWANNVWNAEVGGGPAPAISKPMVVTELPTVRPRGVFDVMPDGRILFVDGRDVGGTPELRLVLNWSAELRRLLPAPQRGLREQNRRGPLEDAQLACAVERHEGHGAGGEEVGTQPDGDRTTGRDRLHARPVDEHYHLLRLQLSSARFGRVAFGDELSGILVGSNSG